ncbi:MAG: hypothetical protein HYX34_00565 [Actinobacteria bacterium]|nr:hypothetical protein [Actinomycetota bacterium]
MSPTRRDEVSAPRVEPPVDADPEEVAAIVAAVEVVWPRPAPPPVAEEAPRWRWSGRWWTKPVPARRDRPW